MSKRHLTGLELERKRLEHIRKRRELKERRKKTLKALEVCSVCGMKHEKVTILHGALMVSATATPATNSGKDSEGSNSTDSEKESIPSPISEESNSTEKGSSGGKEEDEGND